MNIEIDQKSGFCFGVRKAIETAEQLIDSGTELYCLGDIVHNQAEIDRLHQRGLKVIDTQEMESLAGKTVLIRAHGEPPVTYQRLEARNNTVRDATCPVVLKLQEKVSQAAQAMLACQGTVLIFGKNGHPEVVGLVGQAPENGRVISDMKDLEKVDFAHPIRLFAQTTQDLENYNQISEEIARRHAQACEQTDFVVYDTICRQMANRAPHIKAFAAAHSLVIFVGGKKSSNGKYLFGLSKEVNPRSYFVSSIDEIQAEWFHANDRVGICGATSTPVWLMEAVAEHIKNIA